MKKKFITSLQDAVYILLKENYVYKLQKNTFNKYLRTKKVPFHKTLISIVKHPYLFEKDYRNTYKK
jgi:hypothetical protein